MNPARREVYDRYPELVLGLSQMAVALRRLPLEEMAGISRTVRLAGGYVRRDGVTPVDTDLAAWQIRLVDEAIRFRDAINQEPGHPPPPPSLIVP